MPLLCAPIVKKTNNKKPQQRTPEISKVHSEKTRTFSSIHCLSITYMCSMTMERVFISRKKLLKYMEHLKIYPFLHIFQSHPVYSCTLSIFYNVLYELIEQYIEFVPSRPGNIKKVSKTQF